MAVPNILRPMRLLPALLGAASIAHAKAPAPAATTAKLNSSGANAAAVDAMARARLAAQNDPSEVLARYLRTLAENPRDLDALAGAGKAALAIGDANAALAFFARGEEVAPRDGRIKAGLGSALLQLEKPKEAIRLFDEATSLGFPEADLASDRGLAWDLRGDPKRAQKDYSLALKAHRDDETVRRMALSLAASGEGDAGTALLDPLLRRQDRAAWRARAFILAMGGNVGDAEVVARSGMSAAQVIALHPFLVRLATLKPAQKAYAANFGEIPSDGKSYTPSELAMLDGGGGAVRPQAASRLIPAGQPFGARPMEALPGPAAATQPSWPQLVAARIADAARKPFAASSAKPVGAPPAARAALRAEESKPTVAAVPAPAPAPVEAKPAPVEAKPALVEAKPAPVEAKPAPVQVAVAEARPPVTDRPPVSVAGPSVAPVPPPVAVTLQAKPPPAAPFELDASVAARAREEEAARAAAAAAPDRIDTAAPAGIPAPDQSAKVVAPLIAPAGAMTPIVVEAAKEAKPAPPAETVKAAAETKPETKPKTVEVKAKPAGKDEGKAAPDDKKDRSNKATPDTTDKADKTDKKAKPSDDKTDKPDKKAKPDDDKTDKTDKKAKSSDDDKAGAKSAKDAPERVWVQVAGGATKADLPKAWAKLKPKAPALTKSQSTWTTPLRFTNRLLVGPFKDADAAQDYVNRMGKSGLSGFVFTSDKGQEIEKLTTGK